MKRKRKRYSASFKAGAVSLVKEQGRSAAQASKELDLSEHSQAHLNKIARRLNQRPRKTLGFQTPADKLQASVAMTG